MNRRQSLALGVWLASRGGIVASGFVLAAVAALASVAVVAASGGHLALRVPGLTAQIVAWGAGVTVAFGGGLQALRRDRDDGLLVLARARGMGAVSYVQGRVGGLAIVVGAAVAGPTLVAGLAATSFARPAGAAAVAGLGGLAYACAFAATIAPLALAALSARTRLGGYVSLLAVIAAPELASPWTSALLPHGWRELTSIPSALAAVGGAFTSASAALHAARALAALTAVVTASLVVVVARLPDVDPGGQA